MVKGESKLKFGMHCFVSGIQVVALSRKIKSRNWSQKSEFRVQRITLSAIYRILAEFEPFFFAIFGLFLSKIVLFLALFERIGKGRNINQVGEDFFSKAPPLPSEQNFSAF